MNEIACDKAVPEKCTPIPISDITFGEALKILNIEDYCDRITNSNSHGELFYLSDYIGIAKLIKDDSSWFRPWFEKIVKFADVTWKRPESVFQHILVFLKQSAE